MKIQHAKTYQGQDRTASQGNSTKHIKKELIPNLPNLLQKTRGWDTPKFILQGHHYPDTKTKDITKEKITGHISFLGGSDSKKSAYNTGDPGSIPGLGRCPRVRNSYPLQYFCLENCMDRGTWRTTVYRVAKSKIPLNN